MCQAPAQITHSSCVTLGYSLDLSVPQFPHLQWGSQQFPSQEVAEEIKVLIYKVLRKMPGT